MPIQSSTFTTIGRSNVPQEVRDLRQSIMDYHTTNGMPVIHKHRWNLRDVELGSARLCPYHDTTYEQDYSDCPYCFGTGILGGWDDGKITYVTFSDAPINTIEVTPTGVLTMNTQPQMVAPWLPEMGDGDLIITAAFDPENFDVLDLRERYILREVSPVTMRGFQDRVQTVEYKVQQNANVQKMPWGDITYTVPVDFDEDNLPPEPELPPGEDPDEYPDAGHRTSMAIGVRVTGRLGRGDSFAVRDVRVEGLGTRIATGVEIRITADADDDSGVDVTFPPEE